VAFLDMAANQALMAQSVKGDLAAAFARYGIGLDEFNVASVSLPEELQAALDERISAGMKGGLSADKMAGFTKFNVASSIPLAAQNEGGLAGIGAGLGAGAMLGQAMAQGMAGATAQPAAPAAPAELPIEERLAKLKGLLDKGLISAADYDSTKAELLKKLIG
jgi:membrane protease subunit (stomatin/prohibitin family)